MKNQLAIIRLLLVILCAGTIVLQPPPCPAQTVTEHIGTNNPITEAWTFASGTTTAPPPDSLTGGNDGEPYWRIKLVNDASGYYSHALATANLTDASGWTATLRAKVNTADGTYQNCYFGVADGLNAWVLNLGGGPTVSSSSSGVFYISQNGSPPLLQLSPIETLGYRTYQLVYDPTADSGNGNVKYYVDGSLIATLARAEVFAASGSVIEFGDNDFYAIGGTSDAQYALVRFELGQHPIPQPSVVLSRSPLPNASGVDRAATIDIALLDGVNPVQTNLIQLFYNAVAIPPANMSISKPPGTNVTRIHYDPPGLLPASNIVKLVFNDTVSTLVTNSWSFQALVSATVVEHIGTNNPLAEGFFLHADGSPGPVLTSGNDGEDYWRIHQEPFTAPPNHGSVYYRYDLASVFLTNASGWTFTMRAKVNRATGSVPTGGYGAVIDNYYAPQAYGKGWLMAINGGPDVAPENTGVFYAEAAGILHKISDLNPTNSYRTYQMIYDPGNSILTYYADGSMITNLTPADVGFTGPPRIEWGDGTGDAGLVDVQYSLIRFEVGQHPFRPSLAFSRSGNQLTLFWAGTGFVLQTNANFSNSTGWADLPLGTNSPVAFTIGSGALFFRLRQ